MDVDLYGPPLSPSLGDDDSMHDSDLRHVSDEHSGQSEEPSWVVLGRPKNMQIKENTRLGPDTCLSHHHQRRISPLYTYKGLSNPLGPFLIKTNLNTIQTHFFIGK